MRLRRRLVVTMIILVAVGVVALDAILLSSLRAYLYGRVDAQLNTGGHLVAAAVERAEQRGDTVNAGILGSRVGQEVYVVLKDRDGKTLAVHPSMTGSVNDPTPVIPRDIGYTPIPPQSHGTGNGGDAYQPDPTALSVQAGANGPTYRMSAFSFEGKRVVLATRLDTVTATLDSLRTTALLLTVGLLIVLSVLMTLLIRQGLRPLEDMARDADAIAAGDLTRRVAEPAGAAEIASLGLALNGMLAQIETAFEQRRRSEGHLRQFLSDASHELRTPLTAIQGYAELLRKDALPSQEARGRALDRISSEAARMGDLVGDLGILAREGEAPGVAVTRVDLAKVASQAVADTRLLAPGHPITFTTSRSCTVAGDAARLGQLVGNLLTNATRHTPAGTPVEVRVEGDGSSVTLVVRDEGPGLTAEQATHVFDRFWRGHGERLDGGSGLGLSIVASLARTFGGEVRADGEPGRGATFTVVLPAETSGPEPAGAPSAEQPDVPSPFSPEGQPTADEERGVGTRSRSG